MNADTRAKLLILVQSMETESETMVHDFTHILEEESEVSMETILEALRSIASKNAGICIILKRLLIDA